MFGRCQIKSININAVAFLGSESLELYSRCIGVLWLSETDLFYWDKISVWLSSSNDHLGSIFKKCFMSFWYTCFVGTFKVIHKVCSSTMYKYNFLTAVHTNPPQQAPEALSSVSKYSWKQMKFWDGLCWKPRSEPAALVFSRPVVMFGESKEASFLEQWNNLVSWRHCCLTSKQRQLPWVSVRDQLLVFKNSALLHAKITDFCRSLATTQAQLGSTG